MDQRDQLVVKVKRVILVQRVTREIVEKKDLGDQKEERFADHVDSKVIEVTLVRMQNVSASAHYSNTSTRRSIYYTTRMQRNHITLTRNLIIPRNR